jgi:MoaA/NifB/PqqE/SkfB family radical SAM enzyme
MEGRKVELNLGLVCNNSCKFCMNDVPSKERKFIAFDTLSKDLYELFEDGFDTVGFIGGEPTIYPKFLEAIRLAAKIGYTGIHVVSNGRKYSDLNFLEKITKAGVTRYYISIHSHKQGIEDYLTSIEGGFKEKILGISNLVRLRKKGLFKDGIQLNTVVNKLNYVYLPQMIAFFNRYFGLNDFRLNFIWPAGKALNNFESLVPRYSEVMEYLIMCVELARKLNINLSFEAVPYCLLRKVKHSEEFMGEMKDGTRKARFGIGTRDNFFIEERRKNQLKTKSRDCKFCKYDLLCEGVWKKYVEYFGSAELQPLRKFSDLKR